MSRLTEQIGKIPQIDGVYYYERLTTYPKNEWFYPNNAGYQDYAVCDFLARHNLIEKKIIPRWMEGSFYGLDVGFRYNDDLYYLKESEPF